MSKAKPFCISKVEVWEAYLKVRRNRGSSGVDGETLEKFEKDLKNNLYKLWNRLSSGSYFPPPVREVEIPKGDGKFRPLGIPTVADRIAQKVILMRLEPKLEKHFHRDSYGYRPNRSAIEAVGVARKRCWKFDWVLDLDIKGFFDNINHELLMRGVKKHVEDKWVVLYIERWLKAAVQKADGRLINREKGTPQGGVISPLLANLYLHYTFDRWMQRNFPDIPFERFADDIICHCKSEKQSMWLLERLRERFTECKLELHPEKTGIIYCRDNARRGKYLRESFDFLGYTFRPRRAINRQGGLFVSFMPGVSRKALKHIRLVIRRMGLHRRTEKSLQEIAQMLNPVVLGWVNYFRHYYRSALHSVFYHINIMLMRWAMRKYKRRGLKRAGFWLERVKKNSPKLFAHWNLMPLMVRQ